MESTARQFRKRSAILSCLRGTKRHPSADTLYQMLHEEHPDISLATVYRNLALFKSQGLITSLGTVNGVERFDGDVAPHVHFICTDCGSVLDLPRFEVPISYYEEAIRKEGCRIDSCQLMITGKCRECQLKEKNK